MNVVTWDRAPEGAVWLCPGCEREVQPHYRGDVHSGFRVRCPECGESAYQPPVGEDLEAILDDTPRLDTPDGDTGDDDGDRERPTRGRWPGNPAALQQSTLGGYRGEGGERR